MINAGILDGDMVLVEETPAASNGDMVVAMVDDGATVKTFIKRKNLPPPAGERFYGSDYCKRSYDSGKSNRVFRFFK